MNVDETQPFFTKKIIITYIVMIIIIFLCVIVIITTNMQSNNPDNVTNNPTPEKQVIAARVNNANLDQSLNILHSIIQDRYSNQINGYEIARGNLLEDGTWYITNISQPMKDQWDTAKDVYHIVLHQNNNTWEIVTEPRLVLNYNDYPDIPLGVIMSANNYNDLNKK